jgi:hypothetical protein
MLAPNSIVRTIVPASPRAMTAIASFPLRSKMLTMIVLATRPHRANTSPCAKLISCRMP